jgi:hypothetical protein
MKYWVALLFVCSLARAQDVPVTGLSGAPTPGMQAVTTLDLYPIGKHFGADGQWQFGIDKSATVGACVQRELHDGQWLGGYCRDIFILAKTIESADKLSVNQVPMFHVGVDALYNVQKSNGSYGVRAGFNIGGVAKTMLQKAASELPVLESLANWTAPPFIAYIDQITTIDYGVGWRPIHDSSVKGSLTYGPMAMVNIPLSDVWGLISSGL